MTSKYVHIDPATILALPYVQSPSVKHQFVDHLGQLATRLWQVRNSLSLVFSEEHYLELFNQFDAEEYNLGRAKHVKELLIRYLGVRQCVRHVYGDSGLETKIIDPLNDKIGLGSGDAIVAWADLLSSKLLVNNGNCAPGYKDSSISLVLSNTLHVLVGDQKRIFPFYSDWKALVTHLDIVDPELVSAISVACEPKFVWEKTGHGATEYQKRIVVRTAKASKVVIRSGTIYQNPQSRIKRSSVAATDDLTEFRFTVVDNTNVLRGIFKTKSGTVQQSTLALLALRNALDKALAAG